MAKRRKIINALPYGKFTHRCQALFNKKQERFSRELKLPQSFCM
ncbi:hypothetical protein HMPREF9554_02015 [Treponema phagedenis F0421]|nr:hypothetical protein HMPREF9554_02015 [Treponema phagedenis F0421]